MTKWTLERQNVHRVFKGLLQTLLNVSCFKRLSMSISFLKGAALYNSHSNLAEQVSFNKFRKLLFLKFFFHSKLHNDAFRLLNPCVSCYLRRLKMTAEYLLKTQDVIV